MIFQLKVKIKSGAFLGRKKVERVIEVPGSHSLHDLCATILRSVDFDFDHLYEFNIGGRRYESDPSNGSRECKIKLSALRLHEKDTFELWYDFGDDWIFSIEVLAIRNEPEKPAAIISSKGNVDQYPYDDDDFFPFGGDPDDDDDFFPFGADPDDDFDYDQDMMDLEYDYTPPDALFDVAFLYKKTKLWKKLSGEEPFAVRFSDGETGYVTIMGQIGEHCAIAVYPGTEGFASYYRLENRQPADTWYAEKENALSQNCIQMIFDNSEYLMDQELENARAYASAHNIRLAGKNAFPHFMRFEPARQPWHPKSEKEEQYLVEAAEACIFLADLLKNKKPLELGFVSISPFMQEIPLFIKENGSWKYGGRCPLPEIPAPTHTRPEPDGELLKKVKKIPKKGTLQAKIIMFTAPVSDNDGSAPYYPYLLALLRKEDPFMIPPTLVKDLAKEKNEIANNLLHSLTEIKWKPAKIEVADERTYAFMEPITEGLGIDLVKLPETEELDEVLDDFLSSVDPASSGIYPDADDPDGFYAGADDPEAQIMELIGLLLSMPDKDVRMIPAELKEHVRMLLGLGILPPEVEAQLRKKLF